MTPTQQATPNPTKLMSVDEFWDFVNLPENRDRIFELRHGEVKEMSRPTKMHGVVCNRIGTQLQLFADRIGLGYVTSNDAGVVLDENDPGTVVGPDVAYFTDANKFEDVHPKWGDEVPVLAVEVLSPNDKMSEMNAKVLDYLSSGVKVVWVVDYEIRNVTVYRPDKMMVVFKRTDQLAGGDELPGFSILVNDFFKLPGDRAAPQPLPPAA